MTGPVVLPPLAAPVDELWHVLLDLAQALDRSWVLIGGQMVLLHCLEHGREPSQVSQDGDIIANLRAEPRAISTIVAALETRGFVVDGMSPDLIAHRYVRASGDKQVKIDVLAPEGVGARARLWTTPPGRTIEVPGGTQALDRAERVEIVHQGSRGFVRRPSLLAAIVGKGAPAVCRGTPPGTCGTWRCCARSSRTPSRSRLR